MPQKDPNRERKHPNPRYKFKKVPEPVAEPVAAPEPEPEPVVED